MLFAGSYQKNFLTQNSTVFYSVKNVVMIIALWPETESRIKSYSFPFRTIPQKSGEYILIDISQHSTNQEKTPRKSLPMKDKCKNS